MPAAAEAAEAAAEAAEAAGATGAGRDLPQMSQAAAVSGLSKVQAGQGQGMVAVAAEEAISVMEEERRERS